MFFSITEYFYAHLLLKMCTGNEEHPTVNHYVTMMAPIQVLKFKIMLKYIS